jgi:hemin uptake protein HemP
LTLSLNVSSVAGPDKLAMPRIQSVAPRSHFGVNMTEKTQPPSENPVTDRPPAQEAGPLPEVASADLLRGHREMLIHHEGETYRLRLTRTGKLILNK